MKRTKLAIVGIFYDGYYDVWEDFLELFSKNWPDCPYPLYIVNNEAELKYVRNYNVNVIHAGSDAEYSRKVQVAISEIDADYYLLLLEDFFVQKKIDSTLISEIMNGIESSDTKYYRMTIPEFLSSNILRNKEIIKNINVNDEYTLTCQPSIWKKSFLRECIGTENYNAWIFEGVYVYSQNAHSKDFLLGCKVDNSNPMNLRHGAVQGKMIPTVYSDFEKEGYFFKNKREVLDKKEYAKHLKKQKIKGMIPFPLQKVIKKFIRTNSVLERYKDEIYNVMESLGLQ